MIIYFKNLSSDLVSYQFRILSNV